VFLGGIIHFLNEFVNQNNNKCFLPVNKLNGATFLKMISTELFFENVETFLRQQHALLISASVTRWLVKFAQFLGKK
jgi:hypothetical protein